jgi:histidyl-tRNA synthetase
MQPKKTKTTRKVVKKTKKPVTKKTTAQKGKKAPATKKPTKVTKKPAKKKVPPVNENTQEEIKRSAKTYQPVRGMKDILPRDSHYWTRLHDAASAISHAYGYQYVDTPLLEPAQLFVKSIGKGTDVIDKEMYVFEDRDGSKVALRPEFTAGMARSYISNGMVNLPQPVKTWLWGPLFRHNRPQAGRYRQFHSFGCEVIGERDPVIDAELITVAYNFLRDVGIASEVHINSIGTLEDRQNYVVELLGYLRAKRAYVCGDCKKRMNKNPLRVLDCKDDSCKELLEEAPQIIEWLSTDSKDFFFVVLEYLDELCIPYVLRPSLVRGLDYYSDTVFELQPEGDNTGSQSALGGGGRYDALVEELGGREQTAASGFGMGIERIIHALQEKDRRGDPQYIQKYHGPERKIFFAQLGAQARRKMLAIIEQLRQKGMFVGSSLAKGSLKAQLEIAHRMGATHSAILGQKEVQDGTIIVRDMDSGIQEIIDQKKIEPHLRKLML